MRNWKTITAILALSLALLWTGPTSRATAAGWLTPEWWARYQARTSSPPPVPQPSPVPVPAPAPAPQPVPVPTPAEIPTAQETELLQLCNQERVARGIRPLVVDPTLTRLARLKSQDMVDRGYFGHTSPTYGTAYDMMREAGVRYRYAGENLASAVSVASAHRLFMESGPHRSAILNRKFTHVGIGIVPRRGGGVMVTQMFTGF